MHYMLLKSVVWYGKPNKIIQWKTNRRCTVRFIEFQSHVSEEWIIGEVDGRTNGKPEFYIPPHCFDGVCVMLCNIYHISIHQQHAYSILKVYKRYVYIEKLLTFSSIFVLDPWSIKIHVEMYTEELLKYSNNISVPNTRMHMKEFLAKQNQHISSTLKFYIQYLYIVYLYELYDQVKEQASTNTFYFYRVWECPITTAKCYWKEQKET
jgi:hypothetical protein